MKKLTRKEKIAKQQLEPEKKVSAKKATELSKADHSVKRILMLVVALFAFIIYSNTLDHKYVLDDFGVIPENLITKKGVSALPEIFSSTYRAGTNLIDNSLYRPLSKAMFAIEWQMAPDKPALSHWMNVLFYALSCVVLFWVLSLCFKGNYVIPFITSMLFAAHPLHTEVVANIKSRDEILCLLFCLMATGATLLCAKSRKKRYLFLSGILFFLAFLSKESAITWLAVIPLFVYFFTSLSLKEILKSSVPLFVAAIIFLLIRSKIVSSGSAVILIEDNYLSGFKNILTREANAIFLLGVYLKQLIFPISMISDGSYNHFKEVGLSNVYFLISLIVHIALLVFAVIRFKKRDVFSFSIFYYFITLSLVSNVFFLIGTNYGERLLYMPSLAFCLAIAVLLSRIFSTEQMESKSTLSSMISQNRLSMISMLVIALLYSVSTIARNRDWHDNSALYGADVLKVPESAHMHFYYANHISSDDELKKITDTLAVRKIYEKALEHLDISTDIHPRYSDAYQRKGFIYHKLKNFDKASESYEKSISINPTFPVAQNNYANLLFETGRYEEALKNFKSAFRLNPHYSHAAANIASVHGVYGESFIRKAKEDPINQEKYMADARKNFLSAIEYFHIALDLDPEALSACRMLSITYANVGDKENAAKYSAMADRIQSSTK